MSKKYWFLLFCVFGLVSVGSGAELHSCTKEALPLTNEEQLLQVVYCEHPQARILRFELEVSDSDEPVYVVRLLKSEQIEVLVYRLADGKLLEGE